MNWEEFRRFITNIDDNQKSDEEEIDRYSHTPWYFRIQEHLRGWYNWKHRPKEKD